MAIWYWDPVNGNNANDGTTFANRKLNLQNLTLVAAGDTVRCIASPDAVNTGVNATWTDGSNTVTLASAVTQLVASCDTNWTASASVTCTATATGRKDGTAMQNTAVAAGFTTGKAAYFATGALNLSGYQQLTFWMRQTAGTLAVSGDYTMSLCSDVAGATQVNNFALPAITVLNQWFPVTINLATNLGASIQSIAFYINVDRAAVTFQFDNINVSKAAASVDALSVTSLIGKGGTDNQYLGIRSINGTTVILDSAPQYTLDLTGTEPLYSGTTETVALWRRETLKTIQAATAGVTVNAYAGAIGTSVAGVTISGGWNTTDMSTQTGQTYLDGQNGQGYGLQFIATGTMSYLTFSNINAYRYYTGFYTPGAGSSSVNNTIIADNFNNNQIAGLYYGFSKNNTYTITNVVKNGYSPTTNSNGGVVASAASTGRVTINITNLNSNWAHGFAGNILGGGGTLYASTINITNANRNGASGVAVYCSVACTYNLGNVSYNSNGLTWSNIYIDSPAWTPGLTVPSSYPSSHDNIINIGNIANIVASSVSGILIGPGSNNNKIIMTGVFSDFTSSARPCLMLSNANTNYFTSSNAVFGTGQTWAVNTGSSKIYISTNDIIAPTTGSITSQDGAIIIKNAYGVQGQTQVTPSFWNLT